MAKRDLKQVGTITEQIAIEHKLRQYTDRPIMQSLDFYCHITKHIKEFKCPENYMNALNNISNILSNPEFTVYDKDRGTLLYYGKLDDNVCYVVKLNLDKDYSYLASLYPISEKKMERQKERKYYRVS